MIVLNDSTARRIANCLKSMNADNREFCGEPEEGVAELVEILEKPLPEGYGGCTTCRYGALPDSVYPCDACEGTVRTKWEPK